MTIKPIEARRTDRCATATEIYQACAPQRIVSMEVMRSAQSSDGSLDEPRAESDEGLPRQTDYCELRSETGEWVQLFAFELEFFAALDDAKNGEPAAN
jgi:hypothetical protein